MFQKAPGCEVRMMRRRTLVRALAVRVGCAAVGGAAERRFPAS